MIIRRCSQGHRIRIYRNTTPSVTRTKKYSDGSTETLTYPSSYTYFVDVDERVVLEYNSYASGKSDVKKRSFLVRGVANELGTSSYLNIDDGITISLSSANSIAHLTA